MTQTKANLTPAGEIKVGNIHRIDELSNSNFTVILNDGTQREITKKTLEFLQDRYEGQKFPTIKWL